MFRGKCYASSRLKSTKTTDINNTYTSFHKQEKKYFYDERIKEGKICLNIC